MEHQASKIHHSFLLQTLEKCDCVLTNFDWIRRVVRGFKFLHDLLEGAVAVAAFKDRPGCVLQAEGTFGEHHHTVLTVTGPAATGCESWPADVFKRHRLTPQDERLQAAANPA